MEMHFLQKNSPGSRLGFGGAAFSGAGAGYGFGEISWKETEEIMDKALESGIRLFDTAPIYGFGQSEETLGKLLKNNDDVIVVSKSGVSWHENKRVNMSNDANNTSLMLDESLRRLQRDKIDLYMIHWPDARVDIRRPLEILIRAKEIGKIKAIGLCNTNMEDLSKAIEMTSIDALQSEINFFKPLDLEIEKMANQHHISIMSWGLFDKGIIAGSVTRGRTFGPEDARSWAPWWKKSDKDFKMFVMEKIFPVLKDAGHSGIELALKSALQQSHMPLVGAKSVAQLLSVLNGLKNLPSDDLMSQIKTQFLQLKEDAISSS